MKSRKTRIGKDISGNEEDVDNTDTQVVIKHHWTENQQKEGVTMVENPMKEQENVEEYKILCHEKINRILQGISMNVIKMI